MESQPTKNCPQCEKEVTKLSSGTLICRSCGWTNKKILSLSQEKIVKSTVDPKNNNIANNKGLFSNLIQLRLKQYATIVGVVILAVSGLVIFVLSKHERDPYLCSKKQREEIIAKLEPLINDWDDANSLASSTSRINLVTPIGKLQSVQKEVRNLEVPECAKTVIDHFLDMSEDTIDSYLLFMRDEPDYVVEEKISSAKGKQYIFIKYYSNLQQGKSNDRLKVGEEVLEDSKNLLEKFKENNNN